MASVSMAMPITNASQKNRLQPPTSDAFFQSLPVRPSKAVVFNNSSKSKSKIQTEASLKEKAISGLTAAVLTASMIVPDVAQAANSDFSPSLKNFLLSIAVGVVILAALFVAVIGVSNFDPVNRS
ncbi:hypothetical protein ACH5RR_039937 [Cinchona calisaya]|uniref:Photosystem II reaction center X protein n=1 Tax=Cinchona calisaya TaxID=153742 RepID=A0ABD2Y3A1_9GENT